MSEFLHSLVQRSAGAAEQGAIQPQPNPWIRYTADAEELNSGLEPPDSHYPVSDEFTSVTAETDRHLDRFPDDQKQSDNNNEVQPRQDNMNQPIIPDSQNYTERSAGTKDDQESGSGEQTDPREIHPAQPRMESRENMQMIKTDLHIRDKKKPKSETPESPVIETKERAYLEKVIERVTESQIEMQSTQQTTIIETLPVTNQDLERNAAESITTEPLAKMIQPQSHAPSLVDIPTQKKAEPEVVIENLTVEVVREKKAPTVSKVHIPVSGQKRSESQSTDSLKSPGTKLRFGLGQM